MVGTYIVKTPWSGERDSNSRPSAWEADVLPTELSPHGHTDRKYCITDLEKPLAIPPFNLPQPADVLHRIPRVSRSRGRGTRADESYDTRQNLSYP